MALAAAVAPPPYHVRPPHAYTNRYTPTCMAMTPTPPALPQLVHPPLLLLPHPTCMAMTPTLSCVMGCASGGRDSTTRTTWAGSLERERSSAVTESACALEGTCGRGGERGGGERGWVESQLRGLCGCGAGAIGGHHGITL